MGQVRRRRLWRVRLWLSVRWEGCQLSDLPALGRTGVCSPSQETWLEEQTVSRLTTRQVEL
jgi:hypothetical protein